MAGELKHGPLALVDESMPVLMIVVRDPVYIKCINALKQVQARQGRPILICEENDTETLSHSSMSLEVPKTVDCLQVKMIKNLSKMADNLDTVLFCVVSGCSDSHSDAATLLSHCSHAWM